MSVRSRLPIVQALLATAFVASASLTSALAAPLPSEGFADGHPELAPPRLLSFIRGTVFYDFNENGVQDPMVPEEVPIAGWRVELVLEGTVVAVVFTDALGRYEFIRDRDETAYVVREIAPPPGFIPAPGATWLPTTPTEAVVVTAIELPESPDFGVLSFELAPGAGRSKGFWHKQGKPLLQAIDPAWRTALNGTPESPICLRKNISTADPALSIFIVPEPPASFNTAFNAWKSYAVAPAKGHAGYILGVQVAASILNNTAGFMQGTIFVDRFQNGVLVSFDEMVAGAVGLLCDPNGGQTGPKSPFPALREAMLNCSNEFETINNTGDLNQPQVVYKSSRTPETFTSPYGT